MRNYLEKVPEWRIWLTIGLTAYGIGGLPGKLAYDLNGRNYPTQEEQESIGGHGKPLSTRGLEIQSDALEYPAKDVKDIPVSLMSANDILFSEEGERFHGVPFKHVFDKGEYYAFCVQKRDERGKLKDGEDNIFCGRPGGTLIIRLDEEEVRRLKTGGTLCASVKSVQKEKIDGTLSKPWKYEACFKLE